MSPLSKIEISVSVRGVLLRLKIPLPLTPAFFLPLDFLPPRTPLFFLWVLDGFDGLWENPNAGVEDIGPVSVYREIASRLPL